MKHLSITPALLTGSLLTPLIVFNGCTQREDEKDQDRPNILWILAEDASPHLGCYGETTINTPNLDNLAEEGVQFTQAFVTCPVSSPSRSAMVTGMQSVTLGTHNHRSQRKTGKGGGNEEYYESFSLPENVKMIPRLFKEAGYTTTLASWESFNNPDDTSLGKTDYNFVWDRSAYMAEDWIDTDMDKPFFAQIQLSGGKNRNPDIDRSVDPGSVDIPPYYPDTEVYRQDWASYLESWINIDEQIEKIVSVLERRGELENTVIYFWTDHGISHLRAKQFLYEGGIRVPLIVRFPGEKHAGTVNDQLVHQLDIVASSLHQAGIEIPDYIQGRPFFGKNKGERQILFTARDRCDETVDIIRSVRTDQYKYIRNFCSFLPHLQHNRYKDGKEITQTLREMHQQGSLPGPLDSVYFEPRPKEELYDLEEDPHEMNNLADNPRYDDVRNRLRDELYSKMKEYRDMGLIPEPELEEQGRQAGSKYYILRDDTARIGKIIRIIEQGESGDIGALKEGLQSSLPSVQYWSAVWLGVNGSESAVPALKERLEDPSASVRIASGRALCRLGEVDAGREALAEELDNPNLIAEMYALRALEKIGDKALPLKEKIEAKKNSRYEFSRRLAVRISDNLTGGENH
ncbi:MAG: sulfatase-like hydrolase/transferase [Bacteroidota bacterium]